MINHAYFYILRLIFNEHKYKENSLFEHYHSQAQVNIESDKTYYPRHIIV